MAVDEPQCVWRPGHGFTYTASPTGREVFVQYGPGTPCQGVVAVGDPFIMGDVYDLEEGEEESAFCERHFADRTDDI